MKVKFSYYTYRRLRRAFFLACIVGVGILIFGVIENKSFAQVHLALLLGFILGIPLGIFEEFVFAHRLKKMSFIAALFKKGLITLKGKLEPIHLYSLSKSS